MCKAKDTLIVPIWPSNAFWTLLFDKNMRYKQCVIDVLEFEPNQNIFKHEKKALCLFSSDCFNSRVLAVRLCGDEK